MNFPLLTFYVHFTKGIGDIKKKVFVLTKL